MKLEFTNHAKHRLFLERGISVDDIKKSIREPDSIVSLKIMKITYDKKADAMYMYFQKGKKIARTIELADLLIADLDKLGKVIGIEILCVSCQLMRKARNKKEKTASNFNSVDVQMPVFA